MKKGVRTSRGYTIIETVVYIALFAVLSLAFTQTMITIMKSYTQVEGNRDILDASHVVMERLGREIRGSQAIDGNSVFHASTSDIYLSGEDSVGNARTVRIRKNGTNLEFYENGTLSGNLNPASIEVTSFEAAQVTSTNGSAIKFAVTFRNTEGVIVTRTFYNTVVLRGSY